MIDGFLKRKITLHLDFKTKSQARGVKNHFPYNLKTQEFEDLKYLKNLKTEYSAIYNTWHKINKITFSLPYW